MNLHPNQRNGLLIAIGLNPKNEKSLAVLCDCGQLCFVDYNLFMEKKINSCGCLKTEDDKYENRKFNKWTVIKLSKTIKGNRKYECKCECGIIKAVFLSSLLNNKSKSCGTCNEKKLNKKSKYEEPDVSQLMIKLKGQWCYQMAIAQGRPTVINADGTLKSDEERALMVFGAPGGVQTQEAVLLSPDQRAAMPWTQDEFLD